MDIALAQGVAHNLAITVDDTITWLGGIAGLIFLLIGLALVVLVLWAIISTLFHRDTSAGGKFLWILFELWAPLFGAVAWLVVGRKGHLNRLLGIDKGRARHTLPTSVGQHSNVASRSGSAAAEQRSPDPEQPQAPTAEQPQAPAPEQSRPSFGQEQPRPSGAEWLLVPESEQSRPSSGQEQPRPSSGQEEQPRATGPDQPRPPASGWLQSPERPRPPERPQAPDRSTVAGPPTVPPPVEHPWDTQQTVRRVEPPVAPRVAESPEVAGSSRGEWHNHNGLAGS
ncbi:phospholipase D-like protein [Nocardiopsis sp. Huas11]|nr:phospholipase D-like protein [Nocardiopsis sp. Huas11]